VVVVLSTMKAQMLTLLQAVLLLSPPGSLGSSGRAVADPPVGGCRSVVHSFAASVLKHCDEKQRVWV
jgi:hypothetical protein